jgi:hypothetical protein
MAESTAILKLVLHRNIPGDATPARASELHGERRREARPDTPPLHQPTPAECYGCVEWFHY